MHEFMTKTLIIVLYITSPASTEDAIVAAEKSDLVVEAIVKNMAAKLA